jgi:molybdopterin-guanine dinucleotide biosynthesis protein A
MPATPAAAAGAGLPGFDVIILAGGRGTRLGGADKPGLVVGPSTMAAAVAAAAAAAGARQAVLVGPPRAELAEMARSLAGGLTVVREDPPGAGPVPALRAGLHEVRAPWVAVLAADLPFLRAEHLRELLAAASGDPATGAGAVMVDDGGRPQWLAGCWPTGPLAAALAAYGGSSLRGLLGPLRPGLLSFPALAGQPSPWLDCDTPAELAAARSWPRFPLDPTPAQRRRNPAERHPVTTLDRWIETACAEVGLQPDEVAVAAVLGLARDVAHGVERPAAPLTAFLLGLAVGRGQPLDDAARRLSELAARWDPGASGLPPER